MDARCAVGLAVCLLLAGTAQAQATPDFSGMWQRTNESRYFAVPGDTGGKPLAQLPNDNPQVVAGDFDNPILQSWVREIVKKNAETEQKLEYVPTAHGTCYPSGVPEVLNLREPVELLQAKDKVTIIYQRDHQVRQIFLTDKHSEKVAPSWYGESIGRYEGDTLVVDTIGQAAKTFSYVDPFGTPHTEQLHVVERYRVISDTRGKGLEVVFDLEDKGAFTMPWKGMVVYRPAPRSVGFEEVVCAENNRSFDDDTLLAQIPVQKAPEF